MNKLTCGECGRQREQTVLKLIEIDDYCIICDPQHGGECFDTECHIKSRHEGRVSGAKLQMESDQLVVNKLEAERDAAISQVGKLARELGQQDARIKDLEAINEAHRKLNRELRERIKELEELILTKDEALWLLSRIGVAKYFIINRYAVAKLQKIIDKRG